MRNPMTLIATLSLLFACQKPAPRPDPEVTPTPPRVFHISVSAGGGFAGSYSGCTLASDDSVRLWTRSSAGAEETTNLSIGSAGKALQFEKRLVESGALGLVADGTGNMTVRVAYATPDSNHAWSWSGTGENDNTPAPFRGWYSEVQTYCRETAGGTNPK